MISEAQFEKSLFPQKTRLVYIEIIYSRICHAEEMENSLPQDLTEMVVVTFHQIAEAILTNHPMVPGQH